MTPVEVETPVKVACATSRTALPVTPGKISGVTARNVGQALDGDVLAPGDDTPAVVDTPTPGDDDPAPADDSRATSNDGNLATPEDVPVPTGFSGLTIFADEAPLSASVTTLKNIKVKAPSSRCNGTTAPPVRRWGLPSSMVVVVSCFANITINSPPRPSTPTAVEKT